MVAVTLAVLSSILVVGCDGGVESGTLIDPDAFGSDQGTLISIGDVRTVAQEMIASMNASPTLARVRAEKKPVRIVVGNFKQRTSITIFDKEVFINRLVGSMSEVDADGYYVFLMRESASMERTRQESGEVAATSPGPLPGPFNGADLVLTGELREILYREVVAGGGELEKRTVQYSLALDSVDDGVRVWAKAYEIVKEQVTGAVYR